MQVFKCKIVTISMIWLVTGMLVFSLPTKTNPPEQTRVEQAFDIDAIKLVEVSHIFHE
jgi:hypothetical protein